MSQPEASLDALVKLLSAPVVSYLLIAIVQRRKVLLSILQAIFRMLSKQAEEKRITDEIRAVSDNGSDYKDDLYILTLEGANARLKLIEGGMETMSQWINRERKERLEQELSIRAEFDKHIVREEIYRRYTDEKFADAKSYTDIRINELQTGIRRDLDDIKTMLRDMAA